MIFLHFREKLSYETFQCPDLNGAGDWFQLQKEAKLNMEKKRENRKNLLSQQKTQVIAW